jgi:hypothetical protein
MSILHSNILTIVFFFRYIFLPPNSTHLTQPLDVAVFAPMKRKWREVLNKFKGSKKGKGSIPKDEFGGLLKAMLDAGVVNNAHNIRAGFAACGIFPLNVDRVLARLPSERGVGDIHGELSQQLTEQLKKQRYGEPKKKTRAGKSTRLPPGVSYTVSAVTGAG